ncbi:MAG: ABC transporter permease [Dehalococcoidales bacterium]|nr:ABC transporter permease [Dehalococcoidales bacterium]
MRETGRFGCFQEKRVFSVKWIIKNRLTVTFFLLGAVIFLFVVVPLLKMIISSVSSPDTLWATITDPTVTGSIVLTLSAALIATFIGFVLGVPLAYLLARTSFPGKRFIEGLIDVPIVIPHSAAGIALLFVFGRRYLVGQFFANFGITFVDSIAGIVIAMMFVSIPFLVDSAKEAFLKVDVRMEKVARTLGASPWQSFFKVTFPLAWRGILSGSIMMWARGISEFGAVVILAYHPMIAPVLVYERFQTYGLNYAIPVAVILIIVSIVAFILLRTLAQGRNTHD